MRLINNEAELLATQERIDAILDKQNITQEDKDYLKVLGTLVYEYEQKHEPMPVLKGIELIQALMTEENLQPCDLVSMGIQLIPYDSNFQETLLAYKEGAAKYRNAMRELADG